MEGWKGEWCQLPGCPNDCFGNGVCSGDECQCEDEFTGTATHPALSAVLSPSLSLSNLIPIQFI